MRKLIGLFLLCAIVAPASAQDPETLKKLPVGRTPTPTLARFQDGVILVTVTETRYVEERYTAQVPVTKIVNGKQVTEYIPSTRVRKRPVTEFKTVAMTENDASVFDVAGQKIAQDDLAILLKTERLVLMTRDGKPLPAAFKTLYRDDVLVVVPKKPIVRPKLGPAPVPPPQPAVRPAGVRIPVRVRAARPIQLQVRAVEAVPVQVVPVPRKQAPSKEAPPLPEDR